MSFSTSIKRAIKQYLPANLHKRLKAIYLGVYSKFENFKSVRIYSAEGFSGRSYRLPIFIAEDGVTSESVFDSVKAAVVAALADQSLVEIPESQDFKIGYAVSISSRDLTASLAGMAKNGFRIAVGNNELTRHVWAISQYAKIAQLPIEVYRVVESPLGARLYDKGIAVSLYPLEKEINIDYALTEVARNFRNVSTDRQWGEVLGESTEPKGPFDFPVDVVFTWVNGEDKSWQAKKNAHSLQREAPSKKSDTASRYRSRDELKYALRSIEMYAPWVRNIYIVTDRQRPHWYRDNPRIKVIDHTEIFLIESDLPVFNSHAIEANIHRIIGLAENFLYFNDDFFLRSPVSKSTFYSAFGRQSRFFYSNEAYIPFEVFEDSEPVDLAAVNNAIFMEKTTGYRPNRKFQHTPIALKKSTLVHLEVNHPEVFSGTSSSRFRSSKDYSIVSSLAHHYGYWRGAAERSRIGYTYLATSSVDVNDDLQLLKRNRQNYLCYCVNDGDDINLLEEKVFNEVMEAIYITRTLAEL